MARFTRTAAVLAVLAGVLVTGGGAAPTDPPFPERIDLPFIAGPPRINWSPEGITSGPGTTFFLANSSSATTNSLAGGVLKGDYRTGVVTQLVPGGTGRGALGIAYDGFNGQNRIWVAGTGNGNTHVYNADTGALLATYQLTNVTPRTVNDVVVTPTAVYFSDTAVPTVNGVPESAYYKIPLGPGGALPVPDPVNDPINFRKLLSCGEPGTLACNTPPNANGTPTGAGYRGGNGIDVLPNGNLVIASITSGWLWNVNPDTGVARRIMTDQALLSGDGLIVNGSTLYYTANRGVNAVPPAQVVTLKLTPNYLAAYVVARQNSPTDPLNGAATSDQVGHYMYVVRSNAIGAAQDPVRNWLTRVSKVPIEPSGVTVNSPPAVAFTGATAKFYDPDETATPGAYTATINWGDNTTSAGTVTGGGGDFTVTGTRTYAAAGNYHTTTTITDAVTLQVLATVTAPAVIAAAAVVPPPPPPPPTPVAAPRPVEDDATPAVATMVKLTIKVTGKGTVARTPTGTSPRTTLGAGATTSKTTVVSYRQGTDVKLVAKAGANSRFGKWTGCKSVKGTTCQTGTLSGNKTVKLTFAAK